MHRNKGGDIDENLHSTVRETRRKGDTFLLTKLRIFSLLVVANVMWTSPTSAAPMKVKAHTAANSMKLRYVGTASWYGKQHQGLKMANGKRFDRHKLTAASWYFPLGTMIRVVNIRNGESVVVTITDRGPNLRLNRIIDLSEAAAERLDYVGKGLTPVVLYPVASLSTQPATLDSHLVEPGALNASGYDATPSNSPM
jgi:rare lipoprotein A (peptidoglycan hydrolase)